MFRFAFGDKISLSGQSTFQVFFFFGRFSLFGVGENLPQNFKTENIRAVIAARSPGYEN